jgi:hypothetical protein
MVQELPNDLKNVVKDFAELYALKVKKGETEYTSEISMFKKDAQDRLHIHVPEVLGKMAGKEWKFYTNQADVYFNKKIKEYLGIESLLNRNDYSLVKQSGVNMADDYKIESLREPIKEQGQLAGGMAISMNREFYNIDGLVKDRKAVENLDTDLAKEAIIGLSEGASDYLIGLRTSEEDLETALSEITDKGPDACPKTLDIMANLMRELGINAVDMMGKAVDGKLDLTEIPETIGQVVNNYQQLNNSIISSLAIQKYGIDKMAGQVNEAIKDKGYQIIDPTDYQKVGSALISHASGMTEKAELLQKQDKTFKPL